MPIASFANKIFQVDANKIYTFDDFQYTSALQIEKQDAAGKKPSTYNKGPDLDTIAFNINLSVEMGVNPRREWEEWREILASGVAYPFVLGGKPLSNKWLLVDVTPNNFIFTNDGQILSMGLSVQFQEYVRAGSADTSSKASSKVSIPPGILLSDTPVSYTGPEEKSGYKRYNPNMPPYLQYITR